MNRLIVNSARRGERTSRLGLIDRLRGVGPLDDDRQERLNAALADYEASVQRNDTLGAEMADARVEALLAEARAARQQPAQEEPPRRVSFDGGYRGRRPVAPSPHARNPSAAELFRQALSASRAERSDDDQRIVIGNR